MYPSDYGYATSGGSENSRSKCINQNLYYWNYDPEEVDHSDCYENDWLFSSYYDWTLTPSSSSSRTDWVFYNGAGAVGIDDACFAYGIHPSVYLKSDVMIIDGNGTKENPWLLGFE